MYTESEKKRNLRNRTLAIISTIIFHVILFAGLHYFLHQNQMMEEVKQEIVVLDRGIQEA